jgi:hypothetical protein
VGSRSGGRLGEDANPNSNWTGDRFHNLALFFTLGVFFLLGRFVDIDLLETNYIYSRRADLEIPINKVYDMRILTDRVSIHNLDNLTARVVDPDLHNWMGEDFAQLLQTALGLSPPGQGPLLLARAVK